MRAYRLLVAAITVRAVEDYKKALRQLDSNPTYEDAIKTKKEIESFFESDWFKFLCEINDVSRILKKENIQNDK
ncbi:MAG: hypothetical protein OWP43_09425 [Sphaerochaetaceae bacterium]|nr:hypothetical protein [Sphaerochaetaceae bacterium]